LPFTNVLSEDPVTKWLTDPTELNLA